MPLLYFVLNQLKLVRRKCMATLSTSYLQSLLVLTSLLILPNFSIQGAEQQDLLQQSLTVVDKTHQQQKKSQLHINKISNETQKLLKAYQQLNRNTQYQLAYQEQLQKTLTAQEDKKQNLLNKIDNDKTTQQQNSFKKHTDNIVDF